jgi:hypothetical protein
MLEGLKQAEREEVWPEIEGELAQPSKDDNFGIDFALCTLQPIDKQSLNLKRENPDMRTNTIGAKYLLVGVILAAFVAVLVAVARTAPEHGIQGTALIQPVVALVILTAIVSLLMVVYRNLAVIRGTASARYFKTFAADPPAEWVERPARTYMNLLELPVLFYVVCLLMLATGKFDSVQVSLAWVFVITRCAHAFIYIGFNHVPLRFTAFLTGVITLAVIWTRFAEQNLNWHLS